MNKFKKLCNSICINCKIDCCKEYAPFLSEHDKKRIRKINKSESLFNGNYFNTKDKLCPFYDGKVKKCKIETHKPLDCRIYPYSFWFERGKVELWLDLKCPLTKNLVTNKKFYNQALSIAKKELFYWSEGEIFAYLMSGFEIEEFKRQVQGKKRAKLFKE